MCHRLTRRRLPGPCFLPDCVAARRVSGRGDRAVAGKPACAAASGRGDGPASPPVPRGPGRHPADLPDPARTPGAIDRRGSRAWSGGSRSASCRSNPLCRPGFRTRKACLPRWCFRPRYSPKPRPTVQSPRRPRPRSRNLPRPAKRSRPVLLAVVADKTGYPVDMLELDMQLDADLGIDSIKRVEILSAIQDRLPEAPAIKPEHLGTLRTLRQIADFLAMSSPSAASVAQPKAQAAPGRNGDLHPPARGSAGCSRGLAPGGVREDGLPRRHARAGHAARRGPGHRLDQAGRDSVGNPGPLARGAGGQARAPGHAADAPPDRRLPGDVVSVGCIGGSIRGPGRPGPQRRSSSCRPIRRR